MRVCGVSGECVAVVSGVVCEWVLLATGLDGVVPGIGGMADGIGGRVVVGEVAGGAVVVCAVVVGA